MIENEFRKILEEYQHIPNVPFFQKHTANYIKDVLGLSGIEYQENEYVVLVKPKKTFNKKKLLIMAHTDHPGVVLKNSRQGKILGLIGTQHIKEYISKHAIKLRVYGPNGKFIGITSLKEIIPGPKQNVGLEANFNVPRNSMGMFDVPPFKENNDTFELYNADNGLMVSLLLYLLSSKKLGTAHDVYVAFIKHEEVHQMSSWWFAKTNPVGLCDDDYILNLECLKTESIDVEKYGMIDYQGGPVLQLTSTGCLFGYKNPGPNALELLLKKIANDENLNLQTGIIMDSCDSRSFTQFAVTPNICTLTIPNKYKHNGVDDGILRAESVYKNAVEISCKLLISLTTNRDVTLSGVQSLSLELKTKNAITDSTLMAKKELLNKRLAIAHKGIVKRGYFYPQSITDFLLDAVLKIISYIYYVFSFVKKK